MRNLLDTITLFTIIRVEYEVGGSLVNGVKTFYRDANVKENGEVSESVRI